jgi:hypothetical protein
MLAAEKSARYRWPRRGNDPLFGQKNKKRNKMGEVTRKSTTTTFALKIDQNIK